MKNKRSLTARFIEGLFVGFGIGIGVVLTKLLIISSTIGVKMLLTTVGI